MFPLGRHPATLPGAVSRGIAVIVALLLAGCATTGSSDSTVASYFGTRGQTDGQKATVAVIGGMAGGIVTGAAGAGLDGTERRAALEAEYKALEYTPEGQPVTWQNKDGTVRGRVVAAQPYRVGSQDCRQYTHTIDVNGQVKTGRGTACRNSDGTWTLLT